jgi:hypothetical protein
LREELLEAFLRHRHGAELLEVRIGELRVQERVAARFEPRREMDECDLACIRHARKLAFGEECAPQRKAVEPADELALAPALHAMRLAASRKGIEDIDDRTVDPGLAAALTRFRAAADDVGECRVDADLEAVAFHRLRQPPGHMEGLQGKYPALVRPHPEHILCVPALGHRENSEPVSEQQFLGIDGSHV